MPVIRQIIPNVRCMSYLISYFKNNLTQEDIIKISSCDYGMDIQEHVVAINELLEKEDINTLLKWHPHEVISLTRWSIPSKENALMVAFCASTLLMATLVPDPRDYLLSCNENLIISIACTEFLDEDYRKLLYELFLQLEKNLNNTELKKETPFLYLSLYLMEKLYSTGKSFSLITFYKNFEHTVCNEFRETTPPKSIFSLSFSNQRKELWELFIRKAIGANPPPRFCT